MEIRRDCDGVVVRALKRPDEQQEDEVEDRAEGGCDEAHQLVLLGDEEHEAGEEEATSTGAVT